MYQSSQNVFKNLNRKIKILPVIYCVTVHVEINTFIYIYEIIYIKYKKNS